MYAPYVRVTVLDKGLRGLFDEELSFDPTLSNAEPEKKEVGTSGAEKSWYEAFNWSDALKTVTGLTATIVQATQGQGGGTQPSGTSSGGTSASSSGTTDAAILALMNQQNQKSSNTTLYIGLGVAALAAAMITVLALRK